MILSVAAMMAVTMSLAGLASAKVSPRRHRTARRVRRSNAFAEPGNERVLENAVEKCGLVMTPPPPPQGPNCSEFLEFIGGFECTFPGFPGTSFICPTFPTSGTPEGCEELLF